MTATRSWLYTWIPSVSFVGSADNMNWEDVGSWKTVEVWNPQAPLLCNLNCSSATRVDVNKTFHQICLEHERFKTQIIYIYIQRPQNKNAGTDCPFIPRVPQHAVWLFIHSMHFFLIPEAGFRCCFSPQLPCLGDEQKWSYCNAMKKKDEKTARLVLLQCGKSMGVIYN